jgi:hypothetical protein
VPQTHLLCPAPPLPPRSKPPTAPTAVTKGAVTARSIVVGWADSAAPADPAETYTAKCVAKGAVAGAAAIGQAAGIARGVNTATVGGLDPLTDYSCYVLASNINDTLSSAKVADFGTIAA